MIKYDQDELYLILDFLEHQMELYKDLFDQDDDTEQDLEMFDKTINVVKSLIKE